MAYVVTLIAAPSQAALTPALADALARWPGHERISWEEPQRACRWHIRTDDNVRAFLAGVIGAQPIDYIVRKADAPALKLLIADMDSTMITVECIDELADFVGKKAHVAAITERAMNGELDFAAALTERVALLAGLPEPTLQQCYSERVRMMPGAKTLLDAVKRGGGYSVLVSGGFTFFTSRVAAGLGFDEHHANTLEVAAGKLTGRVIPPILGKEAKRATLESVCARRGITAAEAMAVGDGANDVPMLLAAGLGIGYHAKPSVRAQLSNNLYYNDLSALRWEWRLGDG